MKKSFNHFLFAAICLTTILSTPNFAAEVQKPDPAKQPENQKFCKKIINTLKTTESTLNNIYFNSDGTIGTCVANDEMHYDITYNQNDTPYIVTAYKFDIQVTDMNYYYLNKNFTLKGKMHRYVEGDNMVVDATDANGNLVYKLIADYYVVMSSRKIDFTPVRAIMKFPGGKNTVTMQQGDVGVLRNDGTFTLTSTRNGTKTVIDYNPFGFMQSQKTNNPQINTYIKTEGLAAENFLNKAFLLNVVKKVPVPPYFKKGEELAKFMSYLMRGKLVGNRIITTDKTEYEFQAYGNCKDGSCRVIVHKPNNPNKIVLDIIRNDFYTFKAKLNTDF